MIDSGSKTGEKDIALAHLKAPVLGFAAAVEIA